jgi:hypothetical protein
MNEQNTNPQLDSHEEDETPEFSEEDLKAAIATVEALDIFLPTKNLI